MGKLVAGRPIRVRKTEYKYITEFKSPIANTPNYFRGEIKVKQKYMGVVTDDTARGCAIKLDKKLIELGFEPINILKRK